MNDPRSVSALERVARAPRPLPFVVAGTFRSGSEKKSFLPSSSARLRIDRFDHLGVELGDVVHHLLELRLRELLEPLRHHRVLVVLELLHVRHVLVHDPEDVARHPRDREPAHERELDDVPGPDGAHAARLKAVVQRETGGGRADADQQDVLAGVPEGNLRGLGSRGEGARREGQSRRMDRSFDRARGNVRVASRGETPSRSRVSARVRGGVGSFARAPSPRRRRRRRSRRARRGGPRVSPRAARRCGAPGRSVADPATLPFRAARAADPRAADARAGTRAPEAATGASAGETQADMRRSARDERAGPGGGARARARKTALGDDVAMTGVAEQGA